MKAFFLKSSVTRWLPLLIWMAIIFLLSSTPNIFKNLPAVWYTRILPFLPKGFSRPSEIVGALSHFGEYLVLSALLSSAFIGRGNVKKTLLLAALVLSLVYAYYDEIYQINIPGRGFEVSDLVFDALGAVAGLLVYIRARKYISMKGPRSVN